MNPRIARAAITITIVALIAILTLRGGAQTRPATKTAFDSTAEPAPTPKVRREVTPEALAILEQVKTAYGKLKSLDLVGKLTGEFDVDGEKQSDVAEFTAHYSAPNKFRHEVKNDGFMGSDGQKLYAFTKERNLFMTVDAPKEKVLLKELPDPFATLLASQDISLVMAVSKDPVAELADTYPQIEKIKDVTIDNKPCTALYPIDKGKRAMTLALDPATHLVRRVTIDVAPELSARGAAKVEKAQVTIDYSSVAPDAALKDEQFAFAAPAGAKDASQLPEGEQFVSSELVGKPAPDFKLKDIQGKEVTLSSHKGSVVVLDFWATWCGPCIESLPNIDKLYKERKDDGVKVFAVNQSEDKAEVESFVSQNKLSVPVLLDPEGKAGNAYKADPIPLTVVIGKDGVVRKAFTGVGPNTHQEIKDAVSEALKVQ